MKSIIAALVLLACFQFDASAMGIIRRLTNEVPPVVITNAPPVVTNAPPVVVPPSNLPASWNVQEVKRWSAPQKVMAVQPVKRGLVVTHYDRVSRENSIIEEFDGRTWRTIWKGDEETIGAEVMEPATVFGDDVYFAAERGSTFLIYNQTSGKIRRCAKVPSGYKWNVFTALWKGVPVVGADGPDVKASVFDMQTGKKLFQSQLDGLIAGMAEDADGALWLAIADGSKGVVNTAGLINRDIRPSSIAYFPGVGIVAGSQADGRLHHWTGARWAEIANLDCSKINRLAYDPTRQALSVSGAKPDTFALVAQNLTTVILKRFTDEQKDQTGEQFDTDIKPDGAGGYWLARANGGGCYVYRATPGTVTPEPEPPSAGGIYQAINWHKANFAGYTERANLSASIGGGKIRFVLDRAMPGNDFQAVSVCLRDGQYHGGPFDGLGTSGKTLYVKSLTNMGASDNAKKGPYWAGNDAAARAKFRPVSGEAMWVCIVETATKSCSSLAPIVWKE